MINRTLPQWLAYISSTHPSDIEMGLDRIKTVFNNLNRSKNNQKIVLVAGTNGKGSTVAMMEASLLALGYKVGAYTSPHILSYNERVRINGSNVLDPALIQAFENVENARQQTPLTYFEYGTLAAFDILFSVELDVILLEIGLGGRLDAVNIVEPDISIITSVGVDHAEWLGNTVEEIGAEKAGILRQDSLFIGGECMPQSVLKRSETLACKTLMFRQDFNINSGSSSKNVCLKVDATDHVFTGFPSVFLPENNILIAMQAVVCVQSLLEKEKIFDQYHYSYMLTAIEALNLPGRLEKISHPKAQDLFIDVGHNPHAAEFLKIFLLENAKSGKHIQIVYSALVDKDVLSVMEILAPIVDRCVLAPLKSERAMPLDNLKEFAVKAGLRNVVSFASIDKAITDALLYSSDSLRRGEPLLTLIFGSFYIVEAAKRFFETYD
tara:strand:- start:1209 stop:2522 length:1314 start_codon:yes stop_codon:yes gene_type:complete